MIYRNCDTPFPVKRGYQHGSVDHQRSINAGYRKHSNVLRIQARAAAGVAPWIAEPGGKSYDYAVYSFYID